MISAEGGSSPGRSPVNPNALSVTDAARLISAASNLRISAEMIHENIEDGAPTNPDGSLNLVHYAAWLVKEAATRGD